MLNAKTHRYSEVPVMNAIIQMKSPQIVQKTMI